MLYNFRSTVRTVKKCPPTETLHLSCINCKIICRIHINCKIFLIQILMNTIEKDTSTFAELYYALNTLTLLSQKLSTEKSDKLAKTLQAALRKDDSLWK